MRWNAFNLIEDSISRTKKILFPIKLKYWLKLWFVSLFSDLGGTGGGSGGSSNISNSTSSISKNKTSSITGNAISEAGVATYAIGIIVFLIGIFWIALAYVRSIFTFIFIEALVNREFEIGKSWKTNKSEGRSYFAYKIIFSLIVIAGIALALSPVIIGMVQLGVQGYLDSLKDFAWLTKVVPFAIIAIIWILLTSLFNSLVVNFTLPHMYKKNVKIKQAIKEVFISIGKQKMETFIFILALLVVGIGCALISVAIFLVFLIIFGIIGLLIFFSLTLFSQTLAITVIIIYAIFAFLLFSITVLPLSVFRAYLILRSYESLMLTRIFRN